MSCGSRIVPIGPPKDLAPGHVGHDLVEEGDVLGLQGVPSRGEDADDPPVLEEDGHLIAVDGELRVHRDVLIGVLVDDELLEVVRPRDHHFAHAVLHEVEHAHRQLLLRCTRRSLLACATRPPASAARRTDEPPR